MKHKNDLYSGDRKKYQTYRQEPLSSQRDSSFSSSHMSDKQIKKDQQQEKIKEDKVLQSSEYSHVKLFPIRQQCHQLVLQQKTDLVNLKNQTLKKLEIRRQDVMNLLAEVLIKLEDVALDIIRRKIKVILESQERQISKNYKKSIDKVEKELHLYEKKLEKIITVLEDNHQESRRWQGRVAEGTLAHDYQNFSTYINSLPLPHANYELDEQFLHDLLFDIDHCIRKKFDSALSMYSNHYSIINAPEENMPAISSSDQSSKSEGQKLNAEIQVDLEREFMFQGIDDYAKNKNERKKLQFQNSLLKKSRTSNNSINKLTKLSLERKKILEELS